MRKVSTILCAVLFAVISAAPCFALELSADMVSKAGKGKESSSKVYMKENKFRMEMKGANSYSIVRPDKNVMWMVTPGQKMYMEMKVDPKQNPKVEEKVKGEISRKLVGSETIDGHPTKKYEVTYKETNKEQKVYQWFATDIKFGIKTAAIDGSWSTEYRNIKMSNQPDSLFEVPAGYQKMNMPNVPGMGGMMPGKKK